MIHFRHIATVAALAAAVPALAQAPARTIAVDQAWTRETAPGQSVGGGFMRITNTDKRDDRLVSGSSPIAREVQIHTVSMTGGVMRMRPLPDGLAIPAGKTVMLKPGSFHIMLIGLKQPLQRGRSVPVTLHFRHVGKVEVRMDVQAAGAAAPAEGHHHG